LLLFAIGGGLYCFFRWTSPPIEYAFPDRSPPRNGPFACRLVLVERSTRVTGAIKGYLFPPPKNPYVIQHGNVFPPLDNPLVLNELPELCARVEVRNISELEVAVQAQYADNGSISLPRLVGGVGADVRDEEGNEMCFHDYTRNSLKERGATDPETGEDIPARYLEEPKPPILHIAPGQVLTYNDFEILGTVDLDAAIRPGTHRVHAVFYYRTPPEGKGAAGEVHWVESEPITVRLTQGHIDEWRAWVHERLSHPR
jgi:hypothetical protein